MAETARRLSLLSTQAENDTTTTESEKVVSMEEINELMNEVRGRFMAEWLRNPDAHPTLLVAIVKIAEYSDQVVDQIRDEMINLAEPNSLKALLLQPVSILSFETKRDQTAITRVFRICGITHIGDIFSKKDKIRTTRNVGPVTINLLNKALDNISPGLHLDSVIEE